MRQIHDGLVMDTRGRRGEKAERQGRASGGGEARKNAGFPGRRARLSMDATGSGQKETLGTRKRDGKRGRGTRAVGDKRRTAERKARRERGGRESPEKERRSREGALEKQE